MKPTQQEIIEQLGAAFDRAVEICGREFVANSLLERFGAGGGEPVAWMREGWGPDCGPYIEFYRDDEMGWRDRTEYTPLYTHPSPTDLRAEYLRGLEDAAKVCDEVSLQANAAWNMAYRLQDQGRETGADECADAIRALKGKQ